MNLIDFLKKANIGNLDLPPEIPRKLEEQNLTEFQKIYAAVQVYKFLGKCSINGVTDQEMKMLDQSVTNLMVANGLMKGKLSPLQSPPVKIPASPVSSHRLPVEKSKQSPPSSVSVRSKSKENSISLTQSKFWSDGLFKLLRAIILFTFVFCFFNFSRSAVAQQEPHLPGQFVYVDKSDSLLMVRGDPSNPITIVKPPYGFSVYSPRFSPTGTHLAYCIRSSAQDSAPTIFILNTQTFEKKQITSSGSCTYDWSPDGKTFIFAPEVRYFSQDGPSKSWDIYAYSLDSDSIKTLIVNDIPIVDLRWSPDAKQISFFAACFECVGQFYTYNLDSGERKEWSRYDSDWYIGPSISWSPDGKSMVYDKGIYFYTGPNTTLGLYSSSSDGENRKEIFNFTGKSVFMPQWSPNAKKVAFGLFEITETDHTWLRKSDLVTVNPDGTDPQILYSSAHEVHPRNWSPDSKYILFEENLDSKNEVAQSQLVLLDTTNRKTIWTATSGFGGTDWAPLPPMDISTTESPPPVPLSNQSGLLFITPDYALAFFHPETGYIKRLTNAFSGKVFYTSPDGKKILFGNQLLQITINPSGEIVASSQATNLEGKFSDAVWSPDSQYVVFRDTNKAPWFMDLDGNHMLLDETLNFLPELSYDGQWIAYCDKNGSLWVGSSGKSAQMITSGGKFCNVAWSPTESLLAYSVYPKNSDSNISNGTAYLYDPRSGGIKEIAIGIDGITWTDDGKYLSVTRISSMGASAFSYDLFAVDIVKNREVKLDGFNSRMMGNTGWISQKNGYVVGTYQFNGDFSERKKIAELLFDVSFDGRQIIKGSYINDSVEVSCENLETQKVIALYTADMSDVYGAVMPGIYAMLSPDGNWIIIFDYAEPDTMGWITKCEETKLLRLPGNFRYTNVFFSENSKWYISEQTEAGGKDLISKIIVMDPASATISEIQAGLDSHSEWITLPEQIVVPTATAAIVPTQPEVPPISLAENVHSDTDRDLTYILVAAICFVSLVFVVGAGGVGYVYWTHTRTYPTTRIKPDKNLPIKKSTNHEKTEITLSQNPQDFIRSGVEAFNLGNMSETTIAMKRIIVDDPSNSEAWFWLGKVAVSEKAYRHAVQCFMQANKFGHKEANDALASLRNRS